MGIQSWYRNKPTWQRGGIVGILICVLLAVFYITVYNAFLIQSFPEGMLPGYSLFLPIATGHFFMFVSHFIAEGYVAPVLGCVNGNCFSWAEGITFIGSGIMLLLLYFGIGAGIGWFIQKRKKKIIS